MADSDPVTLGPPRASGWGLMSGSRDVRAQRCSEIKIPGLWLQGPASVPAPGKWACSRAASRHFEKAEGQVGSAEARELGRGPATSGH